MFYDSMFFDLSASEECFVNIMNVESKIFLYDINIFQVIQIF